MATYREVIEGLKLLAPLNGGQDTSIPGAEHDVIFGGDVPSPEHDKALADHLEELGWHWSQEFGCWCHFV